MSVRREGEAAWLEGACRVEEAETLVSLLAGGIRVVEVSRCTALHAAVAQVLLAWRPELRGAPADPFLRAHLLPALAGDNVVATSADGDDIETAAPALGREGAEGAEI